MDITMEQKLLKLLLKNEFFKKMQGRVTADMFSDELSPIFGTIEAAHEKYEADISLDEVRALHHEAYTLTRAAKQLINGLLDGIEMEDVPNEDIATTLLSNLYAKHKAFKIAQEATKLMQSGDNDFSSIETILEDKTDISVEEDFDIVSDDVDLLLDYNAPENRFKLRLSTLQERVQGVGRGHFGIIFGRPEVGKSSMTADIIVGFLEQGLKVSYFANEEPGYKIMLNMVRCKLEKSDATLRADKELGTSDYSSWDAVKHNLRLHEAVGMTITKMQKYVDIHKPDVVVADQLDKVSIPGTFSAGHERLKELYCQGREIAKKGQNFFLAISQASADAEGKRTLTFDMLDNSKTGKAGEADLVIGVGINSGVDEDKLRYLTVSKNKISGWKGTLTCMFDPITNKWSA